VSIPRFVEVPVPIQLLDAHLVKEAEDLRERVLQITKNPYPTLSQIDQAAMAANASTFTKRLHERDLQSAFKDYFETHGVEMLASKT